MKKIALVCDSSADITKEEAEKLGVYVLRIPITVNGKEFIEEGTISDQDIIEALGQNKNVETAQPIVGTMTHMWDEPLESYDEAFYIPLTEALSGTCRIAAGTAERSPYQNRMLILDSDFVCYPVVHILLTARDMFEKGYTCVQARERIGQKGELFAILIPETLAALKNGERISPVAATLAGLLKIQPLLKVEHGAVNLVDKVRTLKKAYKEGIEVVLEDINPEEYDWMIIDAYNRKVSDELKATLEEACGQPVEQRIFKSVIMSRTGPGTIGFGRVKKIHYQDSGGLSFFVKTRREYMDGHITLEGNYHKDVLDALVGQMQKTKLSQLVILEPLNMFLEYASLYKEVRATYPCQQGWYRAQNICSIMDYHAFTDTIRRESFPIPVESGICADYFTQHEILLSQMKAAYSYDCFMGYIRFIDNIAYSWDSQPKEMLWDKYNAALLYRRYYEIMYALITSRLFDGVSGFDNIHHMRVKPEYSLQHTYSKLAMLLALQHMYVEGNAGNVLSARGSSGRLNEVFHEIRMTKHIRIVPCSYTERPEEMYYQSF